MSDLFDTEIDGGSKCQMGHPLKLVAEGYAICSVTWGDWYAIRLTPPRANLARWSEFNIVGRDGKMIPAWDGWVGGYRTKANVLAFIQEDIDAHRNLPFDEEAERARMVAV